MKGVLSASERLHNARGGCPGGILLVSLCIGGRLARLSEHAWDAAPRRSDLQETAGALHTLVARTDASGGPERRPATAESRTAGRMCSHVRDGRGVSPHAGRATSREGRRWSAFKLKSSLCQITDTIERLLFNETSF